MTNDLQPTLKPKQLKKNNQIALITPAGPISEQQLAKAQENLLSMGFKSCFSKRVFERNGYLAGDDKTRLTDLHEAFENKQVDAILCIRGGYGTMRILDKIDYSLIKRNPKTIIGYSDITALLNAIWQKTGLVTFHGVVGSSAFSPYTKQQFVELLVNQSANNESIKSREDKLKIITNGEAMGQLVGGNLAMINSLLGTSFEIDFANKIAFFEDVNEAPYKIDRMLTQLLLSGSLQKASGIVLGNFKGCDINNDDITNKNSLSLDEVFNDRLGDLGIPVVSGFSFGHVKDQAIFPIGIKAELDTASTSIKLLENVFIQE